MVREVYLRCLEVYGVPDSPLPAETPGTSR